MDKIATITFKYLKFDNKYKLVSFVMQFYL